MKIWNITLNFIGFSGEIRKAIGLDKRSERHFRVGCNDEAQAGGTLWAAGAENATDNIILNCNKMAAKGFFVGLITLKLK